MFKLVIIEGARGTGKSTISHKLRQTLENSTLINFTGFKDDGDEGLEKIRNYYQAWFELFRKMKYSVKDQIIICDRFFPSEMVYSTLYKDYDFRRSYEIFSQLLPTLADEVILFNFTIHDETELSQRLQRDKVPFGKAQENVYETLKQQKSYKDNIEFLKNEVSKIHRDSSLSIVEIDTTGKTMNDVYSEVMTEIRKE